MASPLKHPRNLLLLVLVWVFANQPVYANAPGTLKWKYPVGAFPYSSPAIGADGAIYIGSLSPGLFAISPDGTLKWKFPTHGGQAWSSPAIGADDTIYVGSNDGNLYAVNPDGTLKWSFALGGAVGTSPVIGTDGTVYLCHGDLYAISPEGTLKWAFAVNGGWDSGYAAFSPAIGADGTVYIGSYDTHLYAISPDGTLKWKFATVGTVGTPPVIGADGTIYVGSNGTTYAINPDGTLKWSLLPTGGAITSAAIGPDGTIYVNAGGHLCAISPDGVKKWEFQGQHPYSSPAVGADGTIYVGGWNGILAINPDGTQQWRFPIDSDYGQVRGSPAIDTDGTVYVGAMNSYLYALNSSSRGLADSPWPMFLHDPRHRGRFGAPQGLTVPLTVGVPYAGTIEQWQLVHFFVEMEAGKSVLVRLAPSSGIHSAVLDGKEAIQVPYVGGGDWTASAPTPRGSYELLISPTRSGTYYFSLFGREIDSGGASYTMTVDPVEDLYLSDVSPTLVGNGGSTALTLEGLNFTVDTEVSLSRAGSEQLTAVETVFASFSKIYATFDLTGMQEGTYDVRIARPGEAPSVLEDALTIRAAVAGQLSATLTSPPSVRPLRDYVLHLEYENNGEADMPAPIWVITNDAEAGMRLSENEPFTKSTVQFLGINRDGPAGTLPQQSSFMIPSYFRVPQGTDGITFEVRKVAADSSPIDWTAVETAVKPEEMDGEAWNVIWNNLKGQLGDTWQEYLQRLDNDATYLSLHSQRTTEDADTKLYDVATLLQFELAKASGRMSPRSVLAASTDLYVPAPGLPLVFSRFAPQSIPARFQQGPLGRGWTHIYHYSASTDQNGNIIIKGPGDSARIFSAIVGGSYQPSPGDFGSISLDGTAIVLQEKDGLISRFGSDGKLSLLQDTNGNTVSFAYVGEDLTTITHSNGESITIQYGDNDKISQVNGPGSQIIQYRYDPQGELLAEVEHAGGVTTSYSYNSADGSASAYALTSIKFPDNSHYNYSYDGQGRLAAEWRDDDAERLTYGYDNQGTVNITDALGNTSTIYIGSQGEILRVQDPHGQITRMSYNSQNLMAELINAQGNSATLEYDSRGNAAEITDARQQKVHMTFEPDRNRLTMLIDARTNETRFGYNANGNLTTITHPDSSNEIFGRDGVGNVKSYTNRRRSTITYDHNVRGQITRKMYPGGRTINYQYDDKGNLTSADDSLTGTISMQYDVRDFLTRIDYPGGYWFTFEYDNAGKRTRRLSHDGQIINYHYDAANRLHKLTDGSALEIIRYEYDMSGRLTKEIKGNGTQTTYEYDAAGRLLHMVNYSPAGWVQSRFDYTYDANGNRTSMTTLEGTTSYGYDATGQLVSVIYPDGHTTTYEYDAAGNRVTVNDNGATTGYTTNNMNQYTVVGAGLCTYDEDGNLISKAEATGTTTYEYDSENRLISVAGPSGETWTYTYDALGNRMRVDHDGAVTRYVHDPMGITDVAAEYDDGGALIATYTHGLGLVARFDGSGGSAYYSFDGAGHTRQLTDSAGAVANTYDYTPFGVPLQENETVPNPFRYVGRFGVMEEGNGLQFMRARYYDSRSGRFIVEDPLSIASGDFNLYRYSGNNPVNFIDPSGTDTLEIYIALCLTSGIVQYGVTRLISTSPVFFEEAVAGFPSLLVFLPGPTYPSTPLSSILLFLRTWDTSEIISGINDSRKLVRDTTRKMIDVFRDLLKDLPKQMQKWSYDIPYMWWTKDLAEELKKQLPREDPCIGTTSSCQNETSTKVVYPIDPNEKVATPGLGDQHFITTDEELTYTVYFENKASATAPAQEVFIYDYLDANLDWSTFKLNEVAFGGHVVSTFAGKEGGEERVVLEGMYVDIQAVHTPGSTFTRWTFRTIDPETGELPTDPLAGFLPPEDGTGCGQGHVRFAIKPKAGLPEGTVITNKASIVFDTEEPLATNEVFNTITDGDGDNDGMDDKWETTNFGDLSRDGTQDYDNDGLKDFDEYLNGTDPKDSDTDDDGMKDGWEVRYGLNPLVNDAHIDSDGDGYTNLQEYEAGTDPNNENSKPGTPQAMPWLMLLLSNARIHDVAMTA